LESLDCEAVCELLVAVLSFFDEHPLIVTCIPQGVAQIAMLRFSLAIS